MKLRPFINPRDYFAEPFPSSNIGILMCSVVSHEDKWALIKDVDCNCIVVKCVNNVVIVPLLNTFIWVYFF